MRIGGRSEAIDLSKIPNAAEETPRVEQAERHFVDPCEILFKPLLGEFLGTLLLDFFAAQMLLFATDNFTVAVLGTAASRYVLMYSFGDICSAEFNPAITLSRLFCLQRSLFSTIAIIGGQLFGAFLGEVISAAVRPSTAQFFPIGILSNESQWFDDRLPDSFLSYFIVELITTLFFVITFLRTRHFGCMAAVTLINMTLSYHAGLETRATGNIAQILAHCIVASIWNTQNAWRYLEAAAAPVGISPLMAALLYWLLSSAREMPDDGVE